MTNEKKVPLCEIPTYDPEDGKPPPMYCGLPYGHLGDRHQCDTMGTAFESPDYVGVHHSNQRDVGTIPTPVFRIRVIAEVVFSYDDLWPPGHDEPDREPTIEDVNTVIKAIGGQDEILSIAKKEGTIQLSVVDETKQQ